MKRRRRLKDRHRPVAVPKDDRCGCDPCRRRPCLAPRKHNRFLGTLPGTCNKITKTAEVLARCLEKWQKQPRQGLMTAHPTAMPSEDRGAIFPARSMPLTVFLPSSYNRSDFALRLIRRKQGLIFVIRILICTFGKIRGFCAAQHKFTPPKSRRLLKSAQSLRPQIPVFAGLFRSSTVSTAIPTTSRGHDTMVNKPLTESHETKSIGPYVAAAAESKCSRGRFNHKKMGFLRGRTADDPHGAEGKSHVLRQPAATEMGSGFKKLLTLYLAFAANLTTR